MNIVCKILLLVVAKSSLFSTEAVLYPTSKLPQNYKVIDSQKNVCFDSDKCFNLIVGKIDKVGKTFVILSNEKVKKVYEFYSNNIDKVYFENDKIYVVFVSETEQYGWIEQEDKDYIFKMFFDKEL